MKNKFYMHEFQFFDGESLITFNIVDLDENKQEIYVAVTRQGKISVITYPLYQDENGWYFKYGSTYEKIANAYKNSIEFIHTRVLTFSELASE